MIENKENINVGTRLASMLLDHFFMTMIIGLMFIPFFADFVSSIEAQSHQVTSNPFGNSFKIIMGLGYALYFLKDIISGRSLAKRILKLQVVDNRTGEVASPLKCFIRNLLIVLWIIEVLVVLGSPNRRLGDQLAGTRVVPFTDAIDTKKFSIKDYILPILIVGAIMVLLNLLFNYMFEGIA
ncbi:MAG: hypothetical protein RL660_2797 [Bacteroidota bacterium]|jgi:uncharacterized RDD family membrane protein YckC